MSTELISPKFADLDIRPTEDAVQLMLDGQLAAAQIVHSQAGAIATAAEASADRLRTPTGRIIYVGAGTSGRLGVLDGVELGPTYDWPEDRTIYVLAGGMDAMLSSVEGAEDDEEAAKAEVQCLQVSQNDVVIGIAASGRTPYTVAAVGAARAAGALTIGIANNPATPLLDVVDHPLLLETGPEIVAGSTRMKAGTAQKIALSILSSAIMLRLGRIHAGLMVDMRLSNRKLRGRAVTMVRQITGADEAAAQAALEKAGGRIKLASLIASGADRDEAARMLTESDHNLRQALERVRPGA